MGVHTLSASVDTQVIRKGGADLLTSTNRGKIGHGAISSIKCCSHVAEIGLTTRRQRNEDLRALVSLW